MSFLPNTRRHPNCGLPAGYSAERVISFLEAYAAPWKQRVEELEAALRKIQTRATNSKPSAIGFSAIDFSAIEITAREALGKAGK